MYNHKKADQYCKECKTTEHTYIDNIHEETYCRKCGLIIQDNTLPSITKEIEQTNLEYKTLRYIYRTRGRRSKKNVFSPLDNLLQKHDLYK